MDEAQLRFFFVFTDLIAPLVVGYLCRRFNVISDKFCNKLIKINIRIIVSILSFLSFWTLKISLDLLWLPIFGILACVVPGVIAKFTFSSSYKNLNDRGAYMMASMLSNIGTLSGLCAFIVYGIQGFAYLQIVAMFQTLFTLCVCFPLANYYHNKAISRTRKHNAQISIRALLFNLNQLPVLAMIIGFILAINDVNRPQICYDIFNSLVHIGAWAGLLPVGYITKFDKAKYFLRKTIDIAVVKFIVLPIIAYFVVINLFDDPVLIGSMIIAFSAPTAINAVLACSIYKLNVNIAISSFISTTIIFLFIIFPLYFFVIKDLLM